MIASGWERNRELKPRDGVPNAPPGGYRASGMLSIR